MSSNKLLTSRQKSSNSKSRSKKLKTIIRNGELRSSSGGKHNKRYSNSKSPNKKPKYVFADEKEEHKYKQYLKSVKMLNQMKKYLSSMAKNASKEVI